MFCRWFGKRQSDTDELNNRIDLMQCVINRNKEEVDKLQEALKCSELNYFRIENRIEFVNDKLQELSIAVVDLRQELLTIEKNKRSKKVPTEPQ